MDIVCRHCNATYRIPDRKIPSRKAAATCKRCGNRIVIPPPSPSDTGATAPVSAPAPAFASAPASTQSSPAEERWHPAGILKTFPQAKDFDAGCYVLAEILKPNRKGRYATRLNRLKMKILAAIQPTLDRLLEKDEKVMRIAGGTAYYPLEIFFGNGFFTMLYNRYALVATDRRLVMMNTNYRMTAKGHYLFQMPYDTIRSLSRGLFRTSLSLKRWKGRRRVFTSMKRAWSADLHAFIKPRIAAQAPAAAEDAGADNLCPSCFTALPARREACPACKAVFKTARKAALRSLLLPGWGDWYLGHRALGALELLGSLMVWVIVVGMLAHGDAASVVVAAFMLAFYNGFDALLTCHMARKGTLLEASPNKVPARPALAVGSA